MGLFEVPKYEITNEKGEKEEIQTAKRDYSKRVEELQKYMDLSVGRSDNMQCRMRFLRDSLS